MAVEGASVLRYAFGMYGLAIALSCEGVIRIPPPEGEVVEDSAVGGDTGVEVVSDGPNVLLIVADDASWFDFGAYGSPDAITPNLDELAAESIRFTRAYAAAPMCSPARHNLYTGMAPVRSGAYPNHTFVQPGTLSVVQYLREVGYRVALTGKSHVEPDVIFDFEKLGAGPEPELDAVDAFVGEVAEADQPFFLVLGSNEPHTPWDKGDETSWSTEEVTLPPSWVDTPETRLQFTLYHSELEVLDTQVGEVLAMLDAHGVADDTLVLFSSEQGAGFPFAKWTLYEAGIRTALTARLPGVVEPGSVSDALVDSSDLLPTVLELAGVEIPEQMEGRSLVPVLRGEADEGKAFSFAEQTSRGINEGPDQYPIRSVTDGDYRLIVNLTPGVTFTNGITQGEELDVWDSWLAKASLDPNAAERVIAYQHRPAIELYDLAADPYNVENLAELDEHQDRIAALQAELDAWMEDNGDLGVDTELAAEDHQVDTNPAPAMPRALTAEAGSGIVELAWEHDHTSELSGFRVFRSEREHTGYTELVALVEGTNFVDDTAGAGRWCYRVRAVAEDGYESWGSYAACAEP